MATGFGNQMGHPAPYVTGVALNCTVTQDSSIMRVTMVENVGSGLVEVGAFVGTLGNMESIAKAILDNIQEVRQKMALAQEARRKLS